MKTIQEFHQALTLKPGYKWFFHLNKEEIDGWDGPYRDINLAASMAVTRLNDEDEKVVYVAKGRRLTKDEREVDPTFDWHVETENSIEIRL